MSNLLIENKFLKLEKLNELNRPYVLNIIFPNITTLSKNNTKKLCDFINLLKDFKQGELFKNGEVSLVYYLRKFRKYDKSIEHFIIKAYNILRSCDLNSNEIEIYINELESPAKVEVNIPVNIRNGKAYIGASLVFNDISNSSIYANMLVDTGASTISLGGKVLYLGDKNRFDIYESNRRFLLSTGKRIAELNNQHLVKSFIRYANISSNSVNTFTEEDEQLLYTKLGIKLLRGFDKTLVKMCQSIDIRELIIYVEPNMSIKLLNLNAFIIPGSESNIIGMNVFSILRSSLDCTSSQLSLQPDEAWSRISNNGFEYNFGTAINVKSWNSHEQSLLDEHVQFNLSSYDAITQNIASTEWLTREELESIFGKQTVWEVLDNDN